MKKKKSTEEFAMEIAEITNKKFKLEGEYKNKNTYVVIRCLNCNNSFTIKPVQFLRKLKCEHCNTQIDLFERYNINTIEDYKNQIKTRTNDFDILSDILEKEGKIKVIHNKCNIEQYVNARNFIHNQICRHCDGGIPVDFYGFTKRVSELYGTEYVVIDRNKNDFTFVHTKCKTKFTMKSGVFLNSENQCPKCEKNTKWDLKKAKKEISQITNKEFLCVDTEYKTVDTPIKIKHTKCNNIFEMSVNSFLKCPKCKICESNLSLGEKYTRDALIDFGFKVVKEYSFEDCKNINALRFDFAVFDKCDNLICLVEFDGEEHYIPLFSDNIDNLMDLKERDNIKNTYCLNNNIILIRIPFWEIDNIKKYISKQLKKHKIDISLKYH